MKPIPINMNDIHFISRDFAKEILSYDFSFSMVTSRGCGHGICSFCYLPMYQQVGNHPKFRYRPVDLVIDEMISLKQKYGINRITFVDEDYFGIHSIGIPRAIELAQKLIDRGVRITYYVNARIVSLVKLIKDGHIPLLSESGLKYVFVGIESGSDEILKKYKKGSTVSQIKRVADELKEYDIKINPGLITFDPELTIDIVKSNIDILRYIGYYDIFMFTRKLILLPGIKVGTIDSIWDLPNSESKSLSNEKYFKHFKTELLYEGMKYYRDKIFPAYKNITDTQIISNELRNILIDNHFNTFYAAYDYLKNTTNFSKTELFHLIDPYVNFVYSHSDIR